MAPSPPRANLRRPYGAQVVDERIAGGRLGAADDLGHGRSAHGCARVGVGLHQLRPRAPAELIGAPPAPPTARDARQRKADMPVIACPSASVWTSAVPS